MSAVDQLVGHWQSHGLSLAEGVQPKALDEFESTYSITLPADVREYFERVNGMLQIAGSDVDGNHFAFWPIEHVRPMTVELQEWSGPVPFVAFPESYFVFADYMQSCWAYAIRLGSNNDDVLLIGGHDPAPVVAHSFAEFVRLYLEDAPALYLGGQD
jgi:hypothetical protein